VMESKPSICLGKRTRDLGHGSDGHRCVVVKNWQKVFF
jgi:hypothetical protein